MLPYYLKSLEILIQHYTVPVAIGKSINDAPDIFKPGLRRMVDRIKVVLVNDLQAIKCQNRSKKISEGNFKKLGQTIDTFAWID